MDERKSFNTTIKVDLLKRAKMFALDHEKRINEVLEAALEEYLGKNEAEKKSKNKK